MDQLGDRIKQIRKKEGLTQELFSQKIGIHKRTLIQYEKGRMIPGSNILKKIIEVFRVEDVDWLLKGPSKKIILREDVARYDLKNIPSLLLMAQGILESDSIYSQALAANIKAFDEALLSEKTLGKHVNCLEEENKKTKAQMAILEGAIKSRNEIPSTETTVG